MLPVSPLAQLDQCAIVPGDPILAPGLPDSMFRTAYHEV